MRALEKADTPNDPVEQTTRAVALAPPSHWPMQLAAAGVRKRRLYFLLVVGERGKECSRRMQGFPIIDSFQGHWQVTFCYMSS